ncbi:MAG: sulfatase-like hydrolase/transferase [Myxococcales bacterium]|nr:sulfatase-like hydrolase/transferase [Myxococcales bacterium]
MPRAVRWVLAGLFALQFFTLDLVLRGPRLSLLSGLSSVLAWGGLALAARPAWSKLALALLAGVLLALQLSFFRHYHTFLDVDAARAARRMWTDVAPVVWAKLPSFVFMSGLLALGELACLYRAAVWAPKPALRLGLVGCMLLPFVSPTPDATAFAAARVLGQSEPARTAGSVHVDELPTRREHLPHVLFLLTESVRASDYCGLPSQACPTAPETAALLPERIALNQLRSLGSYTAIAVNALFAGRMPQSTRERVASTPLCFDFARAVRLGRLRPRVHYWSAQTDSLFERSDVRDAVDSFVTLDELYGRRVSGVQEVMDEGADGLLADYAERTLPSLDGPIFLTVHWSGTHAPYYLDKTRAPFTPYRRVAIWTGLDELHNAYKNAIHAQDVSVARVVRAFLSRVGSEPWLVLFTSDHGEAFGEHKAILHGQNVYEEQIHVPGFVAFGNGALEPAQIEALAAHRDETVTHLDLLPTLLDAWGVWDSFTLSGHKKQLEGQSLLRALERPRSALPVTNCTPWFPCPLANWGVLGIEHALVSQAWDDGWRCVELRSGREGVSMHEAECEQLAQASRTLWPTLPNGRPNR